MAKTTVEVLVDDLDGSVAVETVGIGWNGEWRELDLSSKNLSSLSGVLDKYWNAARPIGGAGSAGRRRKQASSKGRSSRVKSVRDPKVIRAWAIEQGVAVPARGRIPAGVEQQYRQALTEPS